MLPTCDRFTQRETGNLIHEIPFWDLQLILTQTKHNYDILQRNEIALASSIPWIYAGPQTFGKENKPS